MYNNEMRSEDRNSRMELLEIEPSETTDMTNYDDNPHIYSSSWEYVLSIVGITVGFGSFWRFPYLIYKNGGGVFFVPYFISMIVVGIPLLYLETAIGQMHRHSLPFIFKRIHPALKMVGVMFMLNSLHLSSVYNILLTYSYRFIFTSFSTTLPFATEEITDNTYFRETVLKKSNSISQFQAISPELFLLYVFSLLVCHYIVKNGVKSSGKVVAITATAPFVLLFVLMLRGVLLQGAGQGLKYLFEPRWEKIWSGEIWTDAMVQVFYQMGVGMGTLACLSSMTPRRENIMKNIIYVPLGIIVCGLLSAVTIFVYLSHFCLEAGLDIAHPSLTLKGPELSFSVLPKALSLLPMANVWIFFFFITMVLLGIDSLFGMIEALYACLRDEFKQGPVEFFGMDISEKTGRYIILLLIMVGCPSLTSHAGIYYLQFYDYFISNMPFLLVALIEIYVFVYLFKFQQLEREIVRRTKTPTPFIIRYFLESKLLLLLLGGSFVVAFIEQLKMIGKYSVDFYLLGWTITLYPSLLAYFYFKPRWTSREDLKLSFHDIDNPPTYL